MKIAVCARKRCPCKVMQCCCKAVTNKVDFTIIILTDDSNCNRQDVLAALPYPTKEPMRPTVTKKADW
jgi:hypothetical protein